MGALAQELAATLDQFRAQYPSMPESQLRSLAVQQFKQAQGWSEATQQPQQPMQPPTQQPMQAPQGLQQQANKRQVILSR